MCFYSGCSESHHIKNKVWGQGKSPGLQAYCECIVWNVPVMGFDERNFQSWSSLEIWCSISYTRWIKNRFSPEPATALSHLCVSVFVCALHYSLSPLRCCCHTFCLWLRTKCSVPGFPSASNDAVLCPSTKQSSKYPSVVWSLRKGRGFEHLSWNSQQNSCTENWVFLPRWQRFSSVEVMSIDMKNNSRFHRYQMNEWTLTHQIKSWGAKTWNYFIMGDTNKGRYSYYCCHPWDSTAGVQLIPLIWN